jgi:hypothetical protein
VSRILSEALQNNEAVDMEINCGALVGIKGNDIVEMFWAC